MENASKALIMAAEILVGILIISIGVYVFNQLATYSEERTSEIEETQIAQFNEQFLKYVGTVTTTSNSTTTRTCTIHDIVGLANLANETNKNNGFDDDDVVDQDSNPVEGSAYIQIKVITSSGTIRHLENYTSAQMTELIKANDITVDSGTGEVSTIYFECTGYHISEYTKTVTLMIFSVI